MLLHGQFEFVVRAECQEVNVNVRVHCTRASQLAHFQHCLAQLTAPHDQRVEATRLLNQVETDVDQGFEQEFPAVHADLRRPK